MNKISVAIPTYYSSKLIEDTINPLLNNKIIDEIVVTDDSEDKNEFNELSRKINNLVENSSVKIKISKNSKKLGGFKNKYHSVSKTSNDFVYQIDSDNIPSYKSLQFIEKSPENIFDKDLLYLPSRIYLFKKSKYQALYKSRSRIIFSKKTKRITPKYLQNALNQNINFVKDKDVTWLLNVGNPFFYKESYLANLQKGLEKSEEVLAACSIAMCYYWVLSGNDINISSFLRHHHRLRADSYWVTAGENAPNSVNHFSEEIKNL